jgi:hypothetical protein
MNNNGIWFLVGLLFGNLVNTKPSGRNEDLELAKMTRLQRQDYYRFKAERATREHEAMVNRFKLAGMGIVLILAVVVPILLASN